MESSESSSSPSDDHISRSARSSFSDQTRKARRSKDGSNSAVRDVARVLVAREREAMDLKRTLYTLSEQLKAERQRADAAENKTREVLALFKSANEAKNAAEQEAARVNEGLRLYKLQYDNAQEEIRRAQKLIDTLEAQRLDAEEAAAQARSTARQLKEERIIMRAREEGRRQGLEEGLAQGRVIGYEEGRAAGYESGRVATEQAFTSAPVTELDFDQSRPHAYRPPHVPRQSTSEDSIQEAGPAFTQPSDGAVPSPPPVVAPAPIPAAVPAPPPANPSPPAPTRAPEDAQQIHPIPIHNGIMSPSHPQVDIPPDGWIPSLDGDMRIRLPPPHEMAPPPPTSPSPTLSAVLSNVRNIEEPPAMMIPPPANPSSAAPQPANPRHDSHKRGTTQRRRNSTESLSTTMSQFDILGPPSTAPSAQTLRSSTRERPRVLSAIAEESQRTSSSSSPIYGNSIVSFMNVFMLSPIDIRAP